MDEFQKSMKEYLLKISKGLLEDISEQIFECLKKHIRDDMYQPYNIVYLPNNGNRPSEQFLNAFELSGIKKISNKLTRQIMYNWQDMKHWSESYFYTDALGRRKSHKVHAHEDVHGNDVRQALFDILQNRNNLGCIPNRPVSYYNDFWEEFIKDVEANIAIWIKRYFISQGVTDVHIDFNPNELGGDD